MKSEFIYLRIATCGGFREYDHEFSSSLKGGEFFDEKNDY
jgi:hypothetical protein